MAAMTGHFRFLSCIALAILRIDTASLSSHVVRDALGASGDAAWKSPSGSLTPRVKVIYLSAYDAASTDANSRCMQSQLAKVKRQAASFGIDVAYERAPAVNFKKCTDVSSCLAEHPRCFPSARISYAAMIDKGKLRQGLGSWCSMYLLLKNTTAALSSSSRSDFDYLLVLRDDLAIANNFTSSLAKFLHEFPDHWTQVLLDVTSTAFPAQDHWPHASSKGLPVYSMSATRGTYHGSRASLVHASQLSRFLQFYESVPALPTDLLSKVPRPMHMSMWAFQPGGIKSKRRLGPASLRELGHGCDGQVTGATSAPKAAGGTWDFVAKPLALKQKEATHREMVLFGMYDSGTKMLSELITHNLEDPNKVHVCKNYTMWGYCGRIWKHTNPHRLMELKNLRNCSTCSSMKSLKDAVAVVMVRHPFSLIRSLQRHAYDMTCAAGHHGKGLAGPCVYSEPTEDWLQKEQAGMPRLLSAPCETKTKPGGTCWRSLPEAWNSYVSGYLELSRLFHNVVLLRYEDVVEDPAKAVKRIAAAVNLPSPSQVLAVDRALGLPGHGFTDNGGALDKLSTLDYTSNFSCPELQVLCNHLDRGLLFKLGYHGCQHFWPAWGEMIFHGFTYEGSVGKLAALKSLPELPGCVPDRKSVV